MIAPKAAWPVSPEADPFLSHSFELLRSKWIEIPISDAERRRSSSLESLPDDALLALWRKGAQSAARDHRAWYQNLYRDTFRGKRLIDYGCGLGFDCLLYAQHGAQVTFVDLVESNVTVVRRLARLMGLGGCEFLYMEDLRSLDALHGEYDVVYCCGSMINAPLWVIHSEAQTLLRHLPAGGRWIELAYPKARWVRDGSPPFEEWGEMTDGGAPWMEWHDAEKIKSYLAPARFDVIRELDFHDQFFNWIDLIRI
jgi:SAM-dependent methyltransferase